MNRVIVSVDVEDWYHGPSIISPFKSPLKEFLKRNKNVDIAYKYIDTCLKILDEYGIKATFFWVAEYALRFKYLINKVISEGHEIACHGLEHYSKLDPKTKKEIFTKKEFIERTKKAKNILEDISGDEVIGYRAPNAYISGKIFDYLEEIGFKYDSSVSVNSIYNKTSSDLKNVTTNPYFPELGELRMGNQKRGIIEFPWPYYNFYGIKIQSAGGPFLRFFGKNLIINGLKQSLKRGDTIFYFHPIDFAIEKIPIKDYKLKLLWYFKGEKILNQVKVILKKFHKTSTNFKSVIHEYIN